ncbi:MAG: hypothetical protein ACRELY_18295, partial [Polyangiaceae bacterium]
VSLCASPQAMLVVAAPFVSDQPTTKGDELALRIASVLAGKIGGPSHAHPKVASLSVARAVAGHAQGLVYVSAQLEKGELRVTVDSYPALANGWDRARAPAPPPRAHAFATAPVDAEVRTFFSPVLLEQASLHKAHHDEGNVIAAACGDIDDDGGMEIALISRARVSIGHLRGKGDQETFVASKRADWSALALAAPVPLREPLAGASFASNALLAGTSDRGGVELGPDLSARGSLAGIPVGGSRCARVDPAAAAFAGDSRWCGALSDASAVAMPLAHFDAGAVASIVDARGVARSITAARDSDGKLVVRFGTGTRTFDDVGAQVAVGDLDLDGIPEIVTTRNVASDDAIEIWSYDGSQTRERKKIPAPGGVSAFAICPPEANGAPALVAVVGSEVWLVR